MSTRQSVIYWFSATGNSRTVATDLGDALGGTALVRLTASDGSESARAEQVGIVFPVHFFGLPTVVARFLERVTIPPGCYVYTVATVAPEFGGQGAGSPHGQARRLLAERGVDLAGGWSVLMPNNYTPFRGAPPQKMQDRLLSAAEKRTAEIAGRIAARSRGGYEDSLLPIRVLLAPLCRYGRARAPGKDRDFRVLEQCSMCGACVRVCPVANIELTEEGPRWQHRCEQCLACLHWCPVEAIQLGSQTLNRRRYHHPRFRAENFFFAPGGEEEP